MNFHANRFGRASSTYTEKAHVQAQMAKQLISLSRMDTTENILEMGCGTGIFTQELALMFPRAKILATDASLKMLDQAQLENQKIFETSKNLFSNIQYVKFNASGLENTPNQILNTLPFEMAASNALVQWFTQLEIHLQMVASVLRPNGIYLVSGFLKENFPELNSILALPPFNFQHFPGHHKNEIEEAAQKSGFEIETWITENYECIYPSAQNFLHTVSKLGSTRQPEKTPLTRTNLNLLLSNYHKKFSTPTGIRATWKYWVARLKKRN